MKTYKISTTNNTTQEVTVPELVDIIRLDGLDKIEIFEEKAGWEYLENRMMELRFNWNNDEAVSENIDRFISIYEEYLSNPSKEEEFGNLVNESC